MRRLKARTRVCRLEPRYLAKKRMGSHERLILRGPRQPLRPWIGGHFGIRCGFSRTWAPRWAARARRNVAARKILWTAKGTNSTDTLFIIIESTTHTVMMTTVATIRAGSCSVEPGGSHGNHPFQAITMTAAVATTGAGIAGRGSSSWSPKLVIQRMGDGDPRPVVQRGSCDPGDLSTAAYAAVGVSRAEVTFKSSAQQRRRCGEAADSAAYDRHLSLRTLDHGAYLKDGQATKCRCQRSGGRT